MTTALSQDDGAVFPPRDEWDIAAYEPDECVEGYREYRRDPECVPGENRTPAFRWGWLNARRDFTRQDDGFEEIRSAFIKISRRSN